MNDDSVAAFQSLAAALVDVARRSSISSTPGFMSSWESGVPGIPGAAIGSIAA
jgi:hypothetical protein